jgi:type I restriction enzyme M protein
MLDNETKRRIDTARDILVGKVPDPKSQVEQITIALIYKFMDDMDKEAISFGGKPTFFAQPKRTGNENLDNELKDFPKYAWTKIFDPKLGGHEILSLYSEALLKLNLNPNIPQLFRDIFKNAYLPYRDPETLKLFLKIINEFHYDHSEKLGDAFEYLLSILGSQGDAGQFRTPRHIIDFIVEIIQPKKNETILDPACGTAGFLISSYKHILKTNSKKNKGDLLTPDDRKKLMQNFVGYDISPDMVRLSLVNMYLHGFITPNIHEYDTLTSEDRWSEYFDVVIANPPFMSPKGGIKPHKKFTVQANRSEVLFVDYIAEHIHPSHGRAGIIVPEGIIFQSATAYKALRKMLVDKNYLYAVVSLPSGVFNPYSGVKTSILLMDKTLAKKTDKILFVKIENDGFDLGAQRNEIEKNDLPEALNILQQYKEALQNNQEFASESKNCLLVEKKKIGEKEDYNLSFDRYRENGNAKQSHFEMVRLGDYAEILNGFAFKSEKYVNEGIRVIRITNVQKGNIVDDDPKFYPSNTINEISNYILRENDLLVSLTGNVGRVGLLDKFLLPAALNQRVACLRTKEGIRKNFLYSILNTEHFEKDCIESSNGIAQKNLSTVWLTNYSIPLPPDEIQQQIVSKIESCQAIINGARQVVENFKPQIEIKEDWEMVELGSVCEKIQIGPFGTQLHQEDYTEVGIPVVNPKHIKEGKINPVERISEEKANSLPQYFLKFGDIIMARRGEMGRVAFIEKENDGWFCGTGSLFVRFGKKHNGKFYSHVLSSPETVDYLEKSSRGVTMANLNLDIIQKLPIPNISLSEQEEIVKQIEQEQEIVNSNKKLIALYEQKIKDVINKLWKQEPKEYAVSEEKLSMAAED